VDRETDPAAPPRFRTHRSELRETADAFRTQSGPERRRRVRCTGERARAPG
jgi:hypothetical protein